MSPSRKPSWPAWAMLVTGLLLSVFASVEVKRGIETDAVKHFAFVCDQLTLKLRERLDAYALILRGGAALFAASATVERQDWRAYVDTLRAGGSIPGIQGIGFALLVPADRLATHVANIRSQGFPDYNVRPPGKRASYTSIVFLEPFADRNLRAFGFDMFSEPVRRLAMERARDTGEATLSGKVELVQETGSEVQAGTLMYVPVYRRGVVVDTIAQRQAALVGWTYSPYRMNDLMAGILRDWEAHDGQVVALHIYDGHQASAGNLLFDSKPAHAPEVKSLFYQQRTIFLNGNQWALIFDRTPAASTINYAPAWASLAGGLALSGLLFALMLSLIRTRASAVRLAAGLTLEVREKEKLLQESAAFSLSILNSITAEIAVVDHDGVILAVNAPWRRFALENASAPGHIGQWAGVGANYLAVCQPGADPDATGEGDARAGILAVLDGSLDTFTLEYPCHSPTIKRWFRMNVTPLARDAGLGAVITHIDISERKRVEEAIVESRNLLLKIIDTAPVRVFWKDRELCYLGCNQSFATDAGLTHPQQAIGKNDFQLGWAAQAESYRADDRAVMESGSARLAYEERQTTPAGEMIWLRTSKVALSNHDGETIGLVGVYEDITVARQAEDELEQHRHHLEELVFSRTVELAAARDEAEAASRAKSVFMATMSHELRTPMNGIMGMNHLALRCASDPQQIDFLNKSLVCANNLLASINEILDLANLETGTLALKDTDFSLTLLIDEVLQLKNDAALVKGLSLRQIDHDVLLDGTLRGDASRLKQILGNFLSNAIKFSERGQIVVRVQASEISSLSLLLRIEVADQGVGMGPQQQAMLFQSFTQADGSSTRKHGGSGLGLVVARRLARLMGGDAGVVSEAGVGSSFWATLRLRRALSAGDRAAPAPETAAARRG